MSSHFVRLSLLLLVASSCGPEVSDPTITFSDDAAINRVGASWYFVSPVVTTSGGNAAQVQFAVRVRETSGVFMTTPQSKTITYNGTPTQVEVPIEVRQQVRAGATVNLVLEVVGMSWDGVTEHSLTFKSQNYSFVTR